MWFYIALATSLIFTVSVIFRLKHLFLLALALIIVVGTLFIPQSVKFPDRKVELGYPIYFETLDFGNPYTSMGGAPDSYLRSRKFNIMSSWEEYVQTSWRNLTISCIIIFLAIEGTIILIDRAKALNSKK